MANYEGEQNIYGLNKPFLELNIFYTTPAPHEGELMDNYPVGQNIYGLNTPFSEFNIFFIPPPPPHTKVN